MTVVAKCPKCDYTCEFRHEHDAAHGIEGTHMAGSERFICSQCGHRVLAHDAAADRFPFILDKRRTILKHEDEPPKRRDDDDGGASAALLGGIVGAAAVAASLADSTPAEAKPAEPAFNPGGGDSGGAGASGSFDPGPAPSTPDTTSI
jgi:hypothetical protein